MKSSPLSAALGPLALLIACGGAHPEAVAPASPASSAPAAPSAKPSGPAAGPAASAPAGPASPPSAAPVAAPAPRTMALDIAPRSGSKLTGTVTLSEESTGLRVAIALAGVSPGDHGAHVHETPDCGAPDAKSAGGHYNPDSHAHGLPSGAQHHIGDLGNIGVGKDGKGTLEITIADANLKAGDPHSFLGRSIIIHEKKDDGGQPVGNAGGRIGCVEIK